MPYKVIPIIPILSAFTILTELVNSGTDVSEIENNMEKYREAINNSLEKAGERRINEREFYDDFKMVKANDKVSRDQFHNMWINVIKEVEADNKRAEHDKVDMLSISKGQIRKKQAEREHNWNRYNRKFGQDKISGYYTELKFNDFLHDLRDKHKIYDYDWLSIQRKSMFDFMVILRKGDLSNMIAIDVVGYGLNRGKIVLNTRHKDFQEQAEHLKTYGYSRGYFAFNYDVHVCDDYINEWLFVGIKGTFNTGTNIYLSKNRMKSLRRLHSVLTIRKNQI